MGRGVRDDWLVRLDSILPLKIMSKQPFSFKLPLSRFDVTLLAADARKIGSDAFKDAVIAHFVAQYASKGETAIVAVDNDEISVLTLPEGSDPMDFVMTLLESGRIKDAVPYLESMAKATPDNVQVLYNLGIAYSEMGQLDEAIIRLKRAVQLDPTHAHAWTGIGVAYQRMDKHDLAMEPMRKAVEADPFDGYARRNYGAILMGQNRNEEALTHLRAARDALPHDPQTIYGLAAALNEIGGDENVEEADELYVVVIERWPASPVAELARTARTKLANKNMRGKVGGGLRPDVMMYITGALDMFEKGGPTKRQQIAVEIAMKGQSGLDIHDPEQKYTLKTIPGKFSGMHLVSIMYAAFKQIDPTMDAGVDLQREYDAAMAMQKK
jgi:tetratricopeptide (TPR) repeat protein